MIQFFRLIKLRGDIASNLMISGIAFLLVVLRDWYVISNVEESADFYLSFITVVIISSILSNLIYFRMSDTLKVSISSMLTFALSFTVIVSIFYVLNFKLSKLYIISTLVLVLQGIPNGFYFSMGMFIRSKLDRVLTPIIFIALLILEIKLDVAFLVSVSISLAITLYLSIIDGFSVSITKKTNQIKLHYSSLIVLDILATSLPNIFWKLFLELNSDKVAVVRGCQILYSFLLIFTLPLVRTFKASNSLNSYIGIVASLSLLICLVKLENIYILSVIAVIISFLSYFLTKVRVVSKDSKINNYYFYISLLICLFLYLSGYAYHQVALFLMSIFLLLLSSKKAGQ